MKDYYYILGVSTTATTDEIRKAYRKLSVKFHPDKNDGDKFFEDRFKEINEAYDVLSDSKRRFTYDHERIINNNQRNSTNNNTQDKQNTTPPKLEPKINYFTASQDSVAIGELITFRWSVSNATDVELKPFGRVNANGEKTIKVLRYTNPNGIIISLTVHGGINNSIDYKELHINKKIIYNKASNTRNYSYYIKVSFLILLILAGFYLIHLNSKNKLISNNQNNNYPSNQVPAISWEQYNSMINPNNNESIKSENIEPTIPLVVSQWKGNQLNDGVSPFTSCFGEPQKYGNSWILLKNRNGVDAIACLISTLSGETIRNEYIRSGSEFTMTNVPPGSYKLKVVYGNDWNPNIQSPCGSSGFFESDVSFSISDNSNDIIQVETFDTGYSTSYSTHTITLYSVANGNMSQRNIDANEFFSHN